MDIHKLYGIFLPFFRRRRMAHFAGRFRPNPDTKILDVGGSCLNWSLIGFCSQITILNLDFSPDEACSAPPNLSFVKGDGTNLSYSNNSFDIAYSNSVIEHISCYEKQRDFAKEIRRVGKKVWVQTPSKWFFVEPHLITPFIHYLPKQWQRHLIKNFSLWGLVTRPTQEEIDKFVDEVRLLTYKEMKDFFPHCEIYRERFLGFTKSYIAISK